MFKRLEHSGVPVLRVQDVAKTTSGGTPSRNRPEYFEGNIPWLKSGELNDGFIYDAEEYITEEALRNSSAKLFPSGTLIIALYGATTGKTGILGMEAATNQALCALFPKENVERDFLYWYFRMKRQDFLTSSYGGAQPNISQKTIKESLIPVPSSELQKRIVDFLEHLSLDSPDLHNFKMPEPLSDIPKKIANIRNLIKKVEIVRSLRTQALIEAEELMSSALQDLDALKHVSSFDIVSKAIGECSDMKTGKTPPTHVSDYYGDDINWYCPSDLDFTGNGYVGESNKKLSHFAVKDNKATIYGEDTILLVAIGGSIGKVAITNESCSSNQQITGIKFNEEIEPRYGYFWIRKLFLEIVRTASHATLPIINQRKIGSLEIKYPKDKQIQRRIVTHLDFLQKKVDELKRLQNETEKEKEELISSILDKAYKSEL